MKNEGLILSLIEAWIDGSLRGCENAKNSGNDSNYGRGMEDAYKILRDRINEYKEMFG